MAAMLSKSHVLGVIGPIAVGDAKLYVDGFVAGAKAIDKSVTVNPVYTGSFSDPSLMAAAAKSYRLRRARTCSPARPRPWWARSALPSRTTSRGSARSGRRPPSRPRTRCRHQVYNWARVLTQIFTEIRAGKLGGATYTITLGNGSEVIQFNPGYALPANVKAKADEIIKGITDGSISVPQ